MIADFRLMWDVGCRIHYSFQGLLSHISYLTSSFIFLLTPDTSVPPDSCLLAFQSAIRNLKSQIPFLLSKYLLQSLADLLDHIFRGLACVLGSFFSCFCDSFGGADANFGICPRPLEIQIDVG